GDLRLEAEVLALAEEVRFSNLGGDEEFRRGGVTGAELELPRRALLDGNLHVDHVGTVRGGLRLELNAFRLEEAEALHVLLRYPHTGARVKLAFADLQLAADHLVAGLRVSLHRDLAEAHERSLFELVVRGDGAGI